MKSRHLYWLLPFGLIVVLFLTKEANATITLQQADYSAVANTTTTDYANQQFIGGYFSNSNPIDVKFIRLKIVNASTTPTISLDQGAYDGAFQFGWFKQVGNDVYYISNTGSAISFTPHTLLSGTINDPRFTFSGSEGQANKTIYGQNPATSNTELVFPSNVKGLYFQFSSDGSDFGDLINSVSINTISTSTEAISFDWQYHLESATTSSGYYTIYPQFMIWRQESEFVWYNLGTNFGSNSHPNSNIATGTTAGFNLDAERFYQIKNFYLKYDAIGDGSINASTTPVDSNIFYVSSTNPFVPIITIPTSTITSSTIQIQTTCDPDSGFFSYSICNVIRYLFYPDAAVLNLFSGLTAPIQTKPPLGYFTSIKNALTGLTSSTPAFTINISSDNPVKTTFLTPIRTGLIWILWLAFAFWIFHRFRHFNFTNP
jgi:hypothetical protein